MIRKLKCLVCATAALVLATGCNAVSGEAKHTIKYMLKRTPDFVMTPDEIDRYPYTALYMNQEDSPRSLVVLAYADGVELTQNLSWVSSDRETVVTRGGRIIRTEGLHTNLLGTSNLENDPLRCILNDSNGSSICARSFTRQMDFQLRNGTLRSRTVYSEFEVLGKTTLELPQGAREVIHVIENITIEGMRGGRTNEFWLEEDGHVVKSRQFALLNEPDFYLTQVKWVGRD